MVTTRADDPSLPPRWLDAVAFDPSEDPHQQDQIAQERRERLKADAEIFDTLRECGFQGLPWQVFSHRLARYALGVLRGWMASGQLLAAMRANHVMAVIPPELLEKLNQDRDLRDSVADWAVARALNQFRERSIAGTGWDPDRGACLTTYFTVACLFAAGNELARFERAMKRDLRDQVLARESATPSQADDPCEAVTDQLVLRSWMMELEPRDRRIVWGKASGYSNQEIADLFGEPSARAVATRWSRLMSTQRWIARLGGRG